MAHQKREGLISFYVNVGRYTGAVRNARRRPGPAWALHSLDHRVRHTVDVKHVCLSCGKGGGNELMRCSRCQVSPFVQ